MRFLVAPTSLCRNDRKESTILYLLIRGATLSRTPNLYKCNRVGTVHRILNQLIGIGCTRENREPFYIILVDKERFFFFVFAAPGKPKEWCYILSGISIPNKFIPFLMTPATVDDKINLKFLISSSVSPII